MARSKKRRSYGSGCVVTCSSGLAIRWREPVLMPDGTVRRVLRFETLGAVSKKQAAKALRDRLAKSQVPKQAPITFEQLASAWKVKVLPMYKHSTQKHRAHILRKKVLPWFGSMRLDQIRREHVQQFIADLKSRGCAPKSIDHYHDVLSTILSKAVEWDYLEHNPAHGVKMPRIVPVRPKWVLTPLQAQQLLSRLAPWPRTIVGLALLTGARRGELFALRWKAFDPERGTLRIEEAVYDRVIDKPKTERSIRLMPLSRPAVELLCDWRKMAPRTGPEDFIFSTRTGKPKEPRQIMRDHLEPACQALGLTRASWLTFRRTFSTWADQNGVSAKQRGELMGNSAEINAQVYTQVTEEGLRSAVDRVGEQVDSKQMNEQSKQASEQLFTNCSLASGWVN